MLDLNDFPIFETLEDLTPEINTVLWDMDGTILNTETIHFASIVELVSPPKDLNEFQTYCHGKTDAEVLDRIKIENLMPPMDLKEFLEIKEVKFRELVSTKTHDELVSPQIRLFLTRLKEQGYKQAVVTSSERMTTEYLLEKAGLDKFFDYVITREDTSENKPSPAPYLHAMDLLKSSSHEVLIFEDSDVGHAAAVSSGARVRRALWY